MQNLIVVPLSHRSIEYPHRTDYINTARDPEGGTYSLITNDGFRKVIVVTKFGHVLGFKSFIEFLSKISVSDIELVAYRKEMVYRGYQIEPEEDPWARKIGATLRFYLIDGGEVIHHATSLEDAKSRIDEDCLKNDYDLVPSDWWSGGIADNH